jgi:hypothetical protein
MKLLVVVIPKKQNPIEVDIVISIDFIMGLPKLGIKSEKKVVVDHLSKYAHSCALQHPFKASTLAQVFLDNIFKQHGML